MLQEIAALARPITEAALEPAFIPNVRILGHGADAITTMSSMSEVVDEVLETGFYLWYVQYNTLQPHTHAVSAQSHYNQCQSQLTRVLVRDCSTNFSEFAASCGQL